MWFVLTPCRVSFVLCAVIALFVDHEHASHITVADPPSWVGTLDPKGAAA